MSICVLYIQCHDGDNEEILWVVFIFRLRHLNVCVYIKISASNVDHEILLHIMEILSIHLVKLNYLDSFRLDS